MHTSTLTHVKYINKKCISHPAITISTGNSKWNDRHAVRNATRITILHDVMCA